MADNSNPSSDFQQQQPLDTGQADVDKTLLDADKTAALDPKPESTGDSAHDAENGSQEQCAEQQADQPTATYISSDIPPFSDESIQKLSLGFLDKCSPQLSKAKMLLTEATENQRILIETVMQENSKFSESEALAEVTSTMEKAKVYHSKLLGIKKDMLFLHEKSAKLKKRALKLQQQKQKEILQQEQERERQEERERQLLAQPAKPTAKSKS